MHWGVWLSLAMLRFRAFRMCQLVLRMVLWPLFSPTMTPVQLVAYGKTLSQFNAALAPNLRPHRLRCLQVIQSLEQSRMITNDDQVQKYSALTLIF